jgi:uncharacterized protein with PIN domain
MLYLDTSLLVAVLTKEAETGRLQCWLGQQPIKDLTVSDWVATEFSSALSIKLRTGRSGSSIGPRRFQRSLDLLPTALQPFQCRNLTFARLPALRTNTQ